MKKFLALALSTVTVLLSGCGGGGGYSESSYYETTSSGGYATYSSEPGYYSGSKYSQSMPYTTSGREYPVNRTETVRTG